MGFRHPLGNISMQYNPVSDLLFLKDKVDNLEVRLNKTIKIMIKLEKLIYEQCSKQNQKECNSK